MRLHPDEPPADSWRVALLTDVVGKVVRNWPPSRPAVIAIDGRSSSGKTTLAGRVCSLIQEAATVHTDDVAWHHSVFGWTDLLIENILRPVLAGKAVSYRPPEWDRMARVGSIDVPPGIRLLIIEGVGASRSELTALLDGSVWVQSDLDETLARDRARVAAGEIAQQAYRTWMAEEVAFFAEQRPWERAGLLVAGTPPALADPASQVMVANSPQAPA